jgi:hypothetical protein
MIVFSIYKTAQKSRFAPTADAISAFEKRAYLEFSLCLSRACLGKKMIFMYKWLKKPVFAPFRRGG